ncbi:hypothetical protein AAE478_002783 [Parahypoxylon ruwenzoriense]
MDIIIIRKPESHEKMTKQASLRKYGKQHTKPKRSRLFAELPQTPIRDQLKNGVEQDGDDNDDNDDDGDNEDAPKKSAFEELADKISAIKIEDEDSAAAAAALPPTLPNSTRTKSRRRKEEHVLPQSPPPLTPAKPRMNFLEVPKVVEPEEELQVLSWAEICPPGDRIVKIAEASYAEVYRVTNARGTSIIKVIRMRSPIKPQTKAQQKSGLVDEEPHSESDLVGELQISEWLADIPGFVVYKERYIVQGKGCRELLETHQAFHKRLKRQDPDRLQFYPSPSRYLDGTRFLVVELGDAGTALEDFRLESADQLWDIFFHVAIALARAEAQIQFEHRDLHEGNLCIRRVSEPVPPEARDRPGRFGFSGLDVTILDYGLSRAHADHEVEGSAPVAYDLERDLSIFTSEHAAQCAVYRRMRSFLLRGDRVCLPPQHHRVAYEEGVDGPIAWTQHEPYTNVLWLAYIYEWMAGHFRGPRKELSAFKRATREFWAYLNPDAEESAPGFGSASEVVRFALEAGWIEEDQLMGARDEVEKSILSILTGDDEPRRDRDEVGPAGTPLRRSPRRRKQNAV